MESPPLRAPLIAATLGLLAVAPTGTRVAIRVTCDDCTRARALALDVWSERTGPGMPLDIVVTSDALPRLSHWEILVPDIDAAARDEADRLHAAARPADWFAEYHDYTEITARLEELARLAPDRVRLVPIGGSVEGRTIVGLQIGRGTPMLVDGTEHAREWISAAVTTCVADRLVRDYDRDPKIRAFVDHTALWIVPVVNPDGYQYSWAGNRYWRKTRRDGTGVDLNRNFPVAWGGKGSSGNERAEDYRGRHALSEPESLALADLVQREHVALHVDFHSYGQLVLYRWDHTETPAPDRDRFAAIGDRITSAMVAAHDTRYTLMSGVELYPAAGTLSDWMYGENHALSYTIELRPKGRPGFVLPPEEIRPTCDEGLAAVLELRAAMP